MRHEIDRLLIFIGNKGGMLMYLDFYSDNEKKNYFINMRVGFIQVHKN